MMSRFVLIASVVALAGACAQPVSEPQKILNDAAAALGGLDRVRLVRTLILEGEGTLGNLGQDMTPEATTQTFAVSELKRIISLEGDRALTEQVRTPGFPYFQGQAPQKQVIGVDGHVGYNIAPNGTATRVSNVVARDRRAEWHHHPVTLVQVALASDTLLVNPRTESNERLLDVNTSDGLTFTLAIDNSSHLPTRIQSQTDHPNLGDVTIETRFGDYRDVEGVRLPSRITTLTDGVMTADIHVSSQRVNGEPVEIAAPPAAAAAEPIAGPSRATVTVQELAPGTWLLGGQSHHSVLVEFADHLTLIEVPQSEARTLAVIASARELRPTKPLTEAVITHHHFDHSAGLRAAVSEGLTIIGQAAGAAYYKRAVERPHSIAPDALQRGPKPLTFRGVETELVLTDGTQTAVLYHVTASPHADTMLVAYFPRDRLIVEADLFTPGAAANPYASNFADNIKRRGLKVDRIIPLHGTIAPFEELLKTVSVSTY